MDMLKERKPDGSLKLTVDDARREFKGIKFYSDLDTVNQKTKYLQKIAARCDQDPARICILEPGGLEA